VRASRRVLNLAKGFQPDLERMSSIRTALSDITRKIKWTLVFSRPSGTQIEVAAITDSESPLAIERHHVGYRLPVHDSASGCMMLAASTNAVRDRVYGMLEQDPATKPALISDFQARIRRAVAQGFAWHRRAGKREAVMAIPVMGIEPDAVGALAIRYIHSAMTVEDAARNLLPHAREAAAIVEHAWRI
jgi:DNA-binding IclR family transcriptional regulator